MKVLIADDDRISRTYLRAILSGWGYVLELAADGQEACDILEGADPPSIAILDWCMPGMDGIEVVQRLRARPQPVPTYLIMLTGQQSETGLVEALEAGADDYIRKPCKVAELQARVKVGARLAGLQAALNGRVLELENALLARQRVEEALRANEERFRRFFETLPEPVWDFDAETLQILEVNDAAVAHYGYSRQEFLNMKLSELWITNAPEPRAGERTITGGVAVHQAQHRTKDGRTIEVEVFWREIDFGGRKTVLVSVHDITENKRLELELRHSQKLEAVGTLAAGIAHEINTPIQFVGDNVRFLSDAFEGLTRMLANYQITCGQIADVNRNRMLGQLRELERTADLNYLIQETPLALSQTIQGVEQVTRIVRAMKEFAHPDNGNKIASDLNKAIEGVLVVARHEFKLVADVETCFGEMPLIVCEIGEMNQVFLNLIVNAAHAIADKCKQDGGRGLIRVCTCQDGHDVVISIEDTGVGIPEAIRERIFDPFFTTKEVGRGTGQGLAISRNIVVEKHDGTLTFETEVGRGTKFYVRLPICPTRDALIEEESVLKV